MSAHLTLSAYEFELVGFIEPVRDKDGLIVEETPQNRYRNSSSLPQNKYGAGPFCRFRVGRGWRGAGVYALTSNMSVMYVGECDNLEQRYSSTGYGSISPRNCFRGGQETNCRVNNLILQSAKLEERVALWFYAVDGGKSERVGIETELCKAYQPKWNRVTAAFVTG